ncbi:MAG TPA: murein biosynthesis integral membrane protein MurJ [Anaerolineae bacterium]|nr:murein biosynthesis integral membrane protein MurJ [Anaerolineae bacterium]
MATATQPERGQSGIVRNSATMSLFNGLGVLGGLALDMAVAALFGLGQATDGFFLAFTVPQFVMLVLQSSYVNGLVPVLTGLQEGDPDRAWTVFSRLLNLNTVLIGAITVAGWLSAGWITALVGAGLPAARQVEVAQLARILFMMLPPLALAEVMRAQLNALQRFAVPSASNIVRYAAALATLLLGYRAWGIRALAVGYVIGALGQMVFLAADVAHAGGRYRFSWSLADPDLRAATRLLVTRAGGIGLRRSGLIVERFLASFLPAGSVTALSYGRRMSLSLYQVFANSVSTAILPSLSASAQAGDKAAQRRDLRLGYRLLSLTTWPAAALMAALSVPIVRVLFQRGAFDAADTSLTATLLTIYVLNVPALALVQVLLAPLYAGRDAGTPTRHMAWMLGVNILLAWGCMRFLGVNGLAWAATVTAALSLGRAYWLLRELGGLDLGGYTLRVVGASCMAGLAAWATWTVLARLADSGSAVITLLTAAAAGSLGGLLYAAAVWLMRLKDLPDLGRLLRSRIGQRDSS